MMENVTSTLVIDKSEMKDSLSAPSSVSLEPTGSHDGSSQGTEKPVEEQEQIKAASMKEVFQFADSTDWILMALGTIGAIGNGTLLTFFSLFLGDLVDILSGSGSTAGDETLSESLQDEVNWVAIQFSIVAAASYIAAGAEVGLWSVSGYRQAKKVREQYLYSILRQDMTFFDKEDAGSLSSRLAQETQAMQRAMGEKMGAVIHFTCTFASACIMGLWLGWQQSLVVLAVIPIIVAAIAFQETMTTKATLASLEGYSKAAQVAEEALGNIRTVKQFGREQKEEERYTARLGEAEAAGARGGVMSGIGFGIVSGTIMGFFGLALWFGGWLVANEEWNAWSERPYTAGDVVAVVMALLIGAMGLGQMQAPLTAVSLGRAAGAKCLGMIENDPAIDTLSREGQQPNKVEGNITFENIHFRYPTRPEIQILKGFNLTVKAGQTVALVGESGCGKSTTMQLLERFYDPEEGRVLLDGVNIKDLNIQWLRRQIGLVSQEPVLFAGSILENIQLGRPNGDVTLAEAQELCKQSNAHNFISRLPQTYDTNVGDRGAKLSGGQKQRIAIARALARQPKILLLDEATSALDNTSERMVQDALDRARLGRTTLVIAHRLSTIRNADQIASVVSGKVVELGTHDELVAKENGIYAQMSLRQQMALADDKEAMQALQDGANTAITVHDTDETVKASLKSEAGQVSSSSLPESDGEEKKEEEEPLKKVSFFRLVSINKPETHWIILAVLCAGGYGTQFPAFAVLFSRTLAEMQGAEGASEVTSGVRPYAIGLGVLGIFSGFCIFGQISLFTFIGERLTKRLRAASFGKMLGLKVGYFDDNKNSSSSLTGRLATQASEVRGASAERLGLLVQNLVTLVAGLVVGFINGWKLSLVVLACLPFMTLGGLIENMMVQGQLEKIGDDESGPVLAQIMSNHRTVAAFTLEERLHKQYCAAMEKVVQSGIKRARFSGLAYGYSQAIQYAIYGLGFWYGGKLVVDGEWAVSAKDLDDTCVPLVAEGVYDSFANCADIVQTSYGFGKMMEVFFGIVMACWGMGEAMSFAPDASRAAAAVSQIFKLLDNKEDTEPSVGTGKLENVIGNLSFRSVYFRYPTRPEIQVLQGFSLEVRAGETVALVGESGCGKSTTMQLMERFYDPEAGSIHLDGVDIKTLDINWYRQQVGMVSQEPVLFACSIYDNIAYSVHREVTMAEIEGAARRANAHSFISTMPDGYKTLCGDRGTKLSGGQKQRIAIARAIIREPKILLLDEATSALDSQSEKVVQEALDRAREGRTTLVIAHRLSTIRTADKIAGVLTGKVAEIGTHEELLANPDGLYTSLCKASGASH